MSTCISRQGEFGAHTLDDSHTCTLCGVLDEDALRAELEQVRRERDAARESFELLKTELGYTAMQRDWLLAEASGDIRKRYFRLLAEDKALREAAALSVEGKDTNHDH